MWYRVFIHPPPLHVLVLGILITAVSAYVVSLVAARLARGLFVWVVGGKDVAVSSSPAIRRPVRFIGGVVFLVTAAALFFPVIDALGYRARTGLPLHALSDWFFDSGLRALFIAVLAYLAIRMMSLLVHRVEDDIASVEGVDVLERAKRARTLGGVLRKAITALVLAVAFLMILRELRLDIMPLLSAAGIAGIALGFGAQSLVRDLIAGFFLTFEDQLRVGDVVSLDEVSGLVEAINLRTVVLRDFDGTVHIVPAGNIGRLSNKSRQFAYAVLDINVGYDADPDHAMAVLREIGAGLQADPAWQPHVLAPIEVVGIEALGNWSVTIKLRMKTAPLKQWDVGRELRRRIKRTFEEQGISIPFPRQDITVRQA